jgi:hypothetical protein
MKNSGTPKGVPLFSVFSLAKGNAAPLLLGLIQGLIARSSSSEGFSPGRYSAMPTLMVTA